MDIQTPVTELYSIGEHLMSFISIPTLKSYTVHNFVPDKDREKGRQEDKEMEGYQLVADRHQLKVPKQNLTSYCIMKEKTNFRLV
jgi:hypothetical protein